MFILALIPLSLLIAACVPPRVAQPTPMKQSADVDMTCEQIAIEYKSNTGVAAGKLLTTAGPTNASYGLVS